MTAELVTRWEELIVLLTTRHACPRRGGDVWCVVARGKTEKFAWLNLGEIINYLSVFYI
jgi:hypothetical protein